MVVDSVIAVAVGVDHSLALKEDGTAWAWGSNRKGQLGAGTITRSLVPVKVACPGDIAGISAGWDTSFAIRRDGTVWGWGGDRCSLLGDTDGQASVDFRYVDDVVHPTRIPAF